MMKTISLAIGITLFIINPELFGQVNVPNSTYSASGYLGWSSNNSIEVKTSSESRLRIYDASGNPFNRGFTGLGYLPTSPTYWQPQSLLHLNTNSTATETMIQFTNKITPAMGGTNHGLKIGFPTYIQNQVGIDATVANHAGGINFYSTGGLPTATPYMSMTISGSKTGVDCKPSDLFGQFQVGGTTHAYMRTCLGSVEQPQIIKGLNNYLGFNATRNIYGNWKILGNGIAQNGASVIFSNISGIIHFSTIKATNGNDRTLSDQDIMANTAMTLTDEGQLLVGQPTLVSHPDLKLIVGGGILCNKVKVAMDGTANWSWPDFVFSNTYKLKPLSEVESFINENNHLPGVPSACEIEEKGVDLAEMNAKLLQKIEELTLHLIAMNKEIENLKNTREPRIK